MKNLEELLWKENNLKEELPADGTQGMNHACIAICCGGSGMRYTCCPCTIGRYCR